MMHPAALPRRMTSPADAVRRLFEGFFNGRDLAGARTYFTEDFLDRSDGVVGRPGPEGPRRFMEQWLAAFPDVQMRIDDLLVDGDRVAVRWSMRARHLGPWDGFPATGREVRAGGINLYRVREGRICELWSSFDREGLRRQIALASMYA